MGRHWAWFPTKKVLTYWKCGVFFPCRKNSLALLISVNQRSRIHFKRKKKRIKETNYILAFCCLKYLTAIFSVYKHNIFS